MSSLTETIIVAVVVAVAVAWGVRAIWRATRSGTGCSSCSSSGDCPILDKNGDLTQLQDLQNLQNLSDMKDMCPPQSSRK